MPALKYILQRFEVCQNKKSPCMCQLLKTKFACRCKIEKKIVVALPFKAFEERNVLIK